MLQAPTRPTALAPAVGLCALGMICVAVAINLPPIFLTTFAREFAPNAGLTGEQLGRLGAVTFAGLVAGIALTGPLADRLGGPLFTLSGHLLVAAGLAAMALSHSYDRLLLAAFVMDLGAGTLDMILSPIVCVLQPHRRTAAMNLLHSFYCIGAVATILTGALALRHGIPWRSLWFCFVPLPLLVAGGFLFLRLPPLIESGQTRRPLSSLLGSPFFLTALAAIFLDGATEMSLVFWLPTFAEKTLGYSRWIAQIAFLGFCLMMVIGRLTVVLLPRRIRPLPLMFACCAALAALLPLLSFSPGNALALSCGILTGLCVSCLWPSLLAVAGDHFPLGGATMFALLAILGNCGGICMPWLVGIIADHASLRWGLATTAICPLLMMAALSRLNSTSHVTTL